MSSSQAKRRQEQQFIAEGICGRCRKNPLNTKTMCSKCADHCADRLRTLYRRRVKIGLCGKCGDVAEKGSLCEDCRIRQLEGKRKKKMKVGVA